MNYYYSSIISAVYLVACAENLGSDSNDLALLYYQELALGVGLLKSWLFDFTSKSRCLDINVDNSVSNFLIFIENQAIY